MTGASSVMLAASGSAALEDPKVFLAFPVVTHAGGGQRKLLD